MKKSLRKISLLLLLLLLLVPAGTAQAATQKSKALKAYSKKLSSSKVYILPKGKKYFSSINWTNKAYKYTKRKDVRFGLAYIDNDKVPELVLTAMDQGCDFFYGVFTYKQGKVVRITSGAGYDMFKGYYAKKGVICIQETTEGTPYTRRYYKISGTKAKSVAGHFFSSPKGVSDMYYIGSKEVSKAAFKAEYKKYVGSKKMSTVKFHPNTKTNRSKYLK